ncbi:MAG TPA: hypothetical protein VLB73_04625 [Patescibacteria group bacterium]|nr:hypothetical protein [Patescibacteria group bacterium]
MSGKITVGKIVSSATDVGWSQAYHAGGFTAVICVTGEKDPEEKTLASIGKDMLDTLVSEYFTLTTKDLDTINQAVTTTIAKTPKHAKVSLIVAAVIKNVLYAVIANEGRILLKRGDKLGLLLTVKEEDTGKIASASGFLETGDTVLLATPSFGKIFPHEELVQAFDHKSAEELAEILAPKVHNAEDGAASALAFTYHEDETTPAEPPRHDEKHEQEKKEEEKSLPGFETPPSEEKPKRSFSHRQKLFLTITVVLAVVLIGSIFVFQNRQQAAKDQALFASIYQPAKTKYDEAKGLLDLNRALAIQDLQSAQQALQAGQGKFSNGSDQQKQIATLLSQVTTTLTDAQKVPLITASKSESGASPFLEFAAKQGNAYIAQDSTNFYTADGSSITQYNKKTNASKKLVTNNSDWKTLGGFDTYLGNFYLLDTTDGIIKYVSGGGGYTKASYFTSTKPDLSKAVSIAIDSSIWILSSDGTLSKYTKGAQDSLSITGLEKPLSSPTQIVTNADLDNVYILDKGNERIVVLKKDGSFINQYASDTVRTTDRIDVSEKNKKIYLLSGGAIYQLDLQ